MLHLTVLLTHLTFHISCDLHHTRQEESCWKRDTDVSSDHKIRWNWQTVQSLRSRYQTSWTAMLASKTRSFRRTIRHHKFFLWSTRRTVDLDILRLVLAMNVLVICDVLRHRFSITIFLSMEHDEILMSDGWPVRMPCGSVQLVCWNLLMVLLTAVFEQPTWAAIARRVFFCW